MNSHDSLNLLNELMKSDKMRGFPSILLLFSNELTKLVITGAQINDSLYHMTLKLLLV